MKKLDEINLNKIHILDDDRYFLQLVNKLIHKYDKRILQKLYTNNSQFLEDLNNSILPNLLIIDYNLGYQNQYHQTAHKVLNQIDAFSKSIPVILISGESNLGLLEEYSKYRNIEYIVKDNMFAKNLFQTLNNYNSISIKH